MQDLSIREAAAGDLGIVLDLGRKFFNSVGWPGGFEWNRQKVIQSFMLFLTNDKFTIFIEPSGKGFCGVTVQEHFFTGGLVGNEMFWYVEPEYRKTSLGQLMWDTMEEWVKEQGGTHLAMVALDDSDGAKIGKLYESKGYVPIEKSYLKEL